MPQTLLDYAYDFVSENKNPSKFADIWAYVVEKSDFTEEEAASKISRFYTNLMLDGRFVTLGENTWDLRTRHTFDKVHIDMKDVYTDVETTDVDIEELDAEEEKEFKEENSDENDDENNHSEDEETL